MSASDRELENMAKASCMTNAELASALRVIAKIQDDDTLAKWAIGVAAERLEVMGRAAHHAFCSKNAAPASRELAPLGCKRPDQPGQAPLSTPNQ